MRAKLVASKTSNTTPSEKVYNAKAAKKGEKTPTSNVVKPIKMETRVSDKQNRCKTKNRP